MASPKAAKLPKAPAKILDYSRKRNLEAKNIDPKKIYYTRRSLIICFKNAANANLQQARLSRTLRKSTFSYPKDKKQDKIFNCNTIDGLNTVHILRVTSCSAMLPEQLIPILKT